MTRYDVYIPLYKLRSIPRLHLIFFGQVWEKLLIRLRPRISMDILILEQVDWEQFNDKSN